MQQGAALNIGHRVLGSEQRGNEMIRPLRLECEPPFAVLRRGEEDMGRVKRLGEEHKQNRFGLSNVRGDAICPHLPLQ